MKHRGHALLLASAMLPLAVSPVGGQIAPTVSPTVHQQFLGFDRNQYPGDSALAVLRTHFDFLGYWVTNPPGEKHNSWRGKRATIARYGFGFAVLADGRTDAAILHAVASHSSNQTASPNDKTNDHTSDFVGPATASAAARLCQAAAALGQTDADAAVASARSDGFASGTVLFLDQEEGGRLLPEQAAYLFGWTERVARSGLRPGLYLSGQPVPDGGKRTITTARDVQDRVAEGKLPPVVLWIYQDACPPSNGCTLKPPLLTASGTPEATIWQYAQSPRRPQLTYACARTYASDGNCYLHDAQPVDRVLGEHSGLQRNSNETPARNDDLPLDLDLSSSPDPSFTASPKR